MTTENLSNEQTLALACWRMVLELTDEEATSVTILAPNADCTGPAQAIEVTAAWTGWEPRRFEGDGRYQCLARALMAKAAYVPEWADPLHK